MNIQLVKYVVIGALRDKLILSLFLLLLVSLSMALFFGSSAIVEQDQFTLIFASGGLRFASVLGLVLFVVFFMRRSFDTKDIEFVLSRPVSRISFILSYACGFSIIALLFGISVFGAVLAVSPHLIDTGHFLWGASVILEFIIMANVALFFSMILSSSAGAALACFGFYILSRMMGQILGIIQSGLTGETTQSHMLESGMFLVSILMPRLDLMGQTSWLLYGLSEYFWYGYTLIQTVLFVALILLAAIWDLLKRQF